MSCQYLILPAIAPFTLDFLQVTFLKFNMAEEHLPDPDQDLSVLPDPLTIALREKNKQFSALAEQYQGDCLALLAILRMLEQVHREICDGLFQDALPTNRQALYALLRDIEAAGGWPYINRMRLKSLLQYLEQDTSSEPPQA